MTTREDWGWHDDRPCPGWCQSTDHHLSERLEHRTDSFWHKGTVHEVPTEDTTPNLEPTVAEVYLGQRVIVDGRGHNTRPAEVCVDFAGTFTPAGARRLAAIVVELAAQAEAAWPAPDGRR